MFFACIVATVMDIRRRKISNWLIRVVFIMGLLLLFCRNNIICCLEAMGYCILVCIFMYPFFVMRQLGAADVKLFSALPLYFSIAHILQFYLLVFCVGAVLGILKIIIISCRGCRTNHIVDYPIPGISLQCHQDGQVLPTHRLTIPMAVPLTISIAIAIVAKYVGIYSFGV